MRKLNRNKLNNWYISKIEVEKSRSGKFSYSQSQDDDDLFDKIDPMDVKCDKELHSFFDCQ